MTEVLYTNCKLEIRKSPIHGFGVFTNQSIAQDELLEECPYITGHFDGDVIRYVFNWPRHRKDFKYLTIPLGFACIYNCAKSIEGRSIDWDCDEERDLYVFKATKDIAANEELLSYYGPEYWIADETRCKEQ